MVHLPHPDKPRDFARSHGESMTSFASTFTKRIGSRFGSNQIGSDLAPIHDENGGCHSGSTHGSVSEVRFRGLLWLKGGVALGIASCRESDLLEAGFRSYILSRVWRSSEGALFQGLYRNSFFVLV